jgi:hypothetical protein
MTSPMVPWPTQLDLTGAETVSQIYGRGLDFERARYEAAMQRLRVAVEALKRVGSFSVALGSDGANVETMHAIHGCLEEAAGSAIEALAAIGPLPNDDAKEAT